MTPTTSKRPQALSEFLLLKADPYWPGHYPTRKGRTHTSLAEEKKITDLQRRVIESRKTFRSKPLDPALDEAFMSLPVLDDLYSRDLLADVPAMVKRTQELRGMNLARGADPQALAYLSESANCYIHGLFQASVALARAAAEVALAVRIEAAVAVRAGEGEMFGTLLARYGQRFLSADARKAAERVRDRAKQVLHGRRIMDAKNALSALEDARSVIMELSR